MPAFSRKRLHPLVAAAAVATILACLSILATLTGVLSSNQGALVAANAGTPVTHPQANVTAKPGVVLAANKPSPKLSVNESLAPGETLVDLDARSTSPRLSTSYLEKTIPIKAEPSAAQKAPLLSSNRMTRAQEPVKTTRSLKTQRPDDTPLVQTAPRIIPVYRDMRGVAADGADGQSSYNAADSH